VVNAARRYWAMGLVRVHRLARGGTRVGSLLRVRFAQSCPVGRGAGAAASKPLGSGGCCPMLPISVQAALRAAKTGPTGESQGDWPMGRVKPRQVAQPSWAGSSSRIGSTHLLGAALRGKTRRRRAHMDRKGHETAVARHEVGPRRRAARLAAHAAATVLRHKSGASGNSTTTTPPRRER